MLYAPYPPPPCQMENIITDYKMEEGIQSGGAQRHLFIKMPHYIAWKSNGEQLSILYTGTVNDLGSVLLLPVEPPTNTIKKKNEKKKL